MVHEQFLILGVIACVFAVVWLPEDHPFLLLWGIVFSNPSLEMCQAVQRSTVVKTGQETTQGQCLHMELLLFRHKTPRPFLTVALHPSSRNFRRDSPNGECDSTFYCSFLESTVYINLQANHEVLSLLLDVSVIML